MKQCVANNCKSNHQNSGLCLEAVSSSAISVDFRNISFFRFPLSDKERTEAWISALKLEKFVPSFSSRLCSKHFTEDAMYIGKANRRYLTKGSIPSIFDFPPHMSKTKRRCNNFVRSSSSSESKKNMKQCAAFNCLTVRICHDKNNLLKFFSFPRDKTLSNIWLSNCGRLDLQLKNRLPNKLYYSSYKLCSLHFSTKQFVNNTRSKLKNDAVPTIFGDIGLDNNDIHITSTIDEHRTRTEESLKRLNSLIKELEDTNAAFNQGIDIAEVDFGTYSHIKKQVAETALLTFEDITAEDRGTNHDCKSIKINKNPNIITYEEITSEDMMDMKGNLISKLSEVLNNSFEEKYNSLDIDKEIKLEIIDDEDKFKSIQEQIYTFTDITSGDDCERKYEFEKINPILKREIDDDVKLEINLIDDSEKFEKIKVEILMWDEVNTGDNHNLNDNVNIKEVKCENVLSEVDIKTEEIFDCEETSSTPIPIECDDTYRDIPFLTHQISKQNNPSTSDINLGRSFYSSRSVCRKQNQIFKIGSNKPSATSEISYNKNVYSISQAAIDLEQSFKKPKIDRFSLHNSSANDTKKNLVNKVSKKKSDKGNACITTNSSSTAMDSYKKCLAIPVDKNIVYIKLKPFKRKMKMLV